MAVTFNGAALCIELESGVTSVDAKTDLYSAWKDWFKLSDNSKYPFAFDTAGGDPTSDTANVAAFFFIRNDLGWRICPPEEDITITIEGNLYPRDASIPYRTETTGGYTVLLNIERDATSVVETVESTTDASALTLPQFIALK